MDFSDVTASQLPVAILGTVEPGVAIMVSSSPLLKPVFDTMFRRIRLFIGLSDRSKSNSCPSRAGRILTFGGGFVGRSPEGLEGIKDGNNLVKIYDPESGKENEVDIFHENKRGIAIGAAECL